MRTNKQSIAITLIAVLSLFAASCSQSASSGDGDPETSSTTADTTATTEAEVEPAFIPAGADTIGVTDDTVTISFIITDTSAVAQAFGWETPNEGDREAQVAALVEDVNSKGGIAGRTVVPKVHVFNAITDGPVAEEALCNSITQDDQAFAVVLTGQFQENARPCYANAKTLMLDATLYPIDNKGYEELAPYLWSPLLPSYDDLVGGLATSLIDSNWFDGATLGVIAIESGLSQRVYDEQFLPRLTAAGVDVASFNLIDPTDGTSFNNDQLQAIVNFKEAGVDHVVAIGGSRLVSWFIDTSLTQNFSPTYAMSSYDSPDFSTFNYPEQMVGAAGITVLPGFDVDDAQWPFPANDAEQGCADVFTDAGLEVDDRASIRTGLVFCDALGIMKAAEANLTELSAQGLTEAMWAVGDSYTAASVYGVEFNEGSYAGGDKFLQFAFDEGCGCMAVVGDPVDFDG